MSPPDSPSPAAAETEVFLTPATAKAKKPREAEEEEEDADGRGAARMDEAVARAAKDLGGDGDDAADLDGLADDDDAFYPDADAILTEAQRQATEMADQASAALSEGVDALSEMFGWSSASTTTTTTTTAETTARSTTSRPTDAETTTSSRDGVDDPFGIAQGISELWKGIDYLVADATGEGGDGEDAMTTTRGGGSGGGGGVWDGYAVVRRPRAKPPSTTPAQLREKFPALPSGSTLLECFACDVEQRYALATGDASGDASGGGERGKKKKNASAAAAAAAPEALATTPPTIVLPFAGALYVTERHACFAFEPAPLLRGDTPESFVVAHDAVDAVERTNAKDGGGGEGGGGGGGGGVRVTTKGADSGGGKKTVVFGGFQGEELEAALALLEHLASSE